MLTTPIVEGAYYETVDLRGRAGDVHRVRSQDEGYRYLANGTVILHGGKWDHRLTRRVYIVHTDPAEVVAELRERSQGARLLHVALESAYGQAADLVAEKLGVAE